MHLYFNFNSFNTGGFLSIPYRIRKTRNQAKHLPFRVCRIPLKPCDAYTVLHVVSSVSKQRVSSLVFLFLSGLTSLRIPHGRQHQINRQIAVDKGKCHYGTLSLTPPLSPHLTFSEHGQFSSFLTAITAKVQGGSDISGTLSKLPCSIKNYFFEQFFGPKPSQLCAEA